MQSTRRGLRLGRSTDGATDTWGEFVARARKKVAQWHRASMPFLQLMLPRAIWTLLPGSSVRVGPPRKWTTWKDYEREYSTRWKEVLPAQVGEFPAPYWPADGRTPFRLGRAYQWPAQGVAFLKQARVVSVDGWCVAENDTWIGEFSMGGNSRTSPVYALRTQRPPIHLPGRTLNLCSLHAGVNFCHWLMDAVARLELVDRAGIARDSIDHILVPRLSGATAQWVLGRCGLWTDRVLHPGVRDQYECETLLQPSYPGVVETYPSWPIEFYRKTFAAARAAGERRLYLPRRGKRRIANEDQVEELLVSRGFEVFEPEGQTDLHQQFANVTHVVGAHGAALANLVFCQPGTRVLELLPSDMPWRYFYSLCSSGGMPYGVVVGKSLKERRLKVQKATHAPFLVPMDEFRAALTALLSQTARP